MRRLYLDCGSGISGDMAVAALLDLGADAAAVERAIASLDVPGLSVRISHVMKSGVSACDFDVILLEDNHDHDMGYLHGHSDAHVKGGDTGLEPISRMIRSADAPDAAKDLALRIFSIIADAEGRVHGVPAEEVHFHEVGALDSVADILSFAVCFDSLGIEDVIVTGLTDGKGMVRCAHGRMPVPVPAVLEISREHGLPLTIADVEGELVTPTGAAIAAAVRTSSVLPEGFRVLSMGIGAGKRDYDVPGILRAVIVEDSGGSDSVCCLEANIDDCTGEMLGNAAERLMEAGAKDVVYIPIYMKKGRPAYMISVICDPDDADMLTDLIFAETTTIGVRRNMAYRAVLDREIRSFDTSLGRVRAKVCRTSAGLRAYPEYEDVASVSEGIPFRDAYRRIAEECGRQLSSLE